MVAYPTVPERFDYLTQTEFWNCDSSMGSMKQAQAFCFGHDCDVNPTTGNPHPLTGGFDGLPLGSTETGNPIILQAAPEIHMAKWVETHAMAVNNDISNR